jgi:SAM-dependent methyltransferase
MENIFTKIYENKIWGDNKNNHYLGSSGGGSLPKNNKEYIKIVKNIIIEYKINTIVDLGCGDFQIGRLLYDDIDVLYTGYDTYKKMIDYHITQYPEPKYTFKHLDFYTNKDSIVEGDMCILKDVIQHWTINEIYTFMDYIIKSKKFKYILIINCCNQKIDNQDEPLRSRSLSCNFLPLKK